MEVSINEYREWSGHDGPKRWYKEEYFLGQVKQRSKGAVCHLEVMF